MADSLHLGVAAFVFIMLLIGVILTILEFRRVIRDSEGEARPKRAAAGTGSDPKPSTRL